MNKNLLSAFAVIFLLTGCARLQDGYQFGDATLSLWDARTVYCTSSNPTARKIAARAIDFYVPGYPREGICKGLDP